MTSLTVVMPVYNGMPYLPAAVESMLGQSFNDFEFLIIDDGSTDGSREYLEGLGDPRIRIDRQEHLGLRHALNRSLESVQTELYARMDADDISMPGRLEAEWKFLRSHPEVVLVGTQINYLSGERTITGPPVPVAHGDIARALLQGRAAIRHPTCMMRTKALQVVGGYRLQYSEDHDLFLRLSELGVLANLREVLLIYRMHLGSTFVANFELYLLYRAYTTACYHMRRCGKPEPALSQFAAAWAQCGMVQKAMRRIDAWSAFQYRRALVDLGTGHKVNATAHMVGAALCRPRDSVMQIISRVKRAISGSRRTWQVS